MVIKESKERPEEEGKFRFIPTPVNKLEGLKIVKTFEGGIKGATQEAIEMTNGIVDYLKKTGAKEIMPENSELGRILFG